MEDFNAKERKNPLCTQRFEIIVYMKKKMTVGKEW